LLTDGTPLLWPDIETKMRVSVFGLGYVGAVSCACLAELGHDVVGVDVSQEKVDQINAGASPIVEQQLPEIVKKAVDAGKLRATTSAKDAVSATDVALVCVGTPSRPNGSLDTRYVEEVVRQIGEEIRNLGRRFTIVVRSTLLPGTTLGTLAPIIEAASGLKLGEGFGLGYNPEFLREGTAIRDFWEPPFTIVGGVDEASLDAAAGVYSGVDAPIRRLRIEEAEMVKYSCNAFHALKITFANEIGNFASVLGVDGHVVMDLVCQDKKLNLSSYYMKPGFAYGGSCLPKDLRAILFAARSHDLAVPMLESLSSSNLNQIKRGIDMVLATKKRKVTVLGFSFKAGTDDLRESPNVELIETLLGKGCDMKLYDRNVSWARLVGANKSYIEKTIPHISSLMADDLEAAIAHGDVIVIGNADPDFVSALAAIQNSDKIVIDLVRPKGLSEEWIAAMGDRYHGICW
jgi:GDP-mannose 6-dehydrogenase